MSWGAEPFERLLAETFGSPWPKTIEAVMASRLSIENDDRFGPFSISRHRFERTLDADTFVAVTRTYGGDHSEERDAALRDLIAEVGGSVTKVEEAVLYLAQRL